MPEKVIRTNWDEDLWDIIYQKQAELQKKKLRNVTVGQAIEVLLKDAYLRKRKLLNER
jgi:hypothetical protein